MIRRLLLAAALALAASAARAEEAFPARPVRHPFAPAPRRPSFGCQEDPPMDPISLDALAASVPDGAMVAMPPELMKRLREAIECEQQGKPAPGK